MAHLEENLRKILQYLDFPVDEVTGMFSLILGILNFFSLGVIGMHFAQF